VEGELILFFFCLPFLPGKLCKNNGQSEEKLNANRRCSFEQQFHLGFESSAREIYVLAKQKVPGGSCNNAGSLVFIHYIFLLE